MEAHVHHFKWYYETCDCYVKKAQYSYPVGITYSNSYK